MRKLNLGMIMAIVLFIFLVNVAKGNDNEYSVIFDSATEEDYEALREVLFWEVARADCGINKDGQYYFMCYDCPFELYLAVGETVLNRCIHNGYPNTIYEVCHKRQEFVCKPLPKLSWEVEERIDDTIAELVNGGRAILPSRNYIFFATKKQSCAKNHILIGTKIGHRMWFGEEK